MSKLKLYTVDMKYIRNPHNVDDKVPSVSPQIGKDERPFVGVVAMINGRKYCIPLTKPKDKHKTMRGGPLILQRLFIMENCWELLISIR